MMMNVKAIFALIIVFAVAVLLLLTLTTIEASIKGFISPMRYGSVDLYYYANVARNMLTGRGMTTNVMFPIVIGRSSFPSPQPDLLHPPFFTLFLALAMAIFSKSIWVIVSCNFFFYFLTIFFVFILTLRIFDLKTATLSGIFLAANANILGECVWEDYIPVLALFSILFYTLYAYNDRTLIGCLLPGAVLGLCYLSRYGTIVFLPAVAWYIYRASSHRKLQSVILCIAAFFAVISPWLIRNLVVSGNPFFSLAGIRDTYDGPGLSSLLKTDGAWAPGNISVAVIVQRVKAQLITLTFVTGNFLTPLFLLAILYKLGDKRFEKLRQLTYILILIVIGTQLFYTAWPPHRPYLIFYPFVIPVAVACFFRLAENFTAKGKHIQCMAIAVFILINAMPILISTKRGIWESEPHFKGYWAPLLEKVDRESPIISDSAHIISWYEDRKTILMPENIEDLNKMRESLQVKHCLLFSDLFSDYEIGSGIDPSLTNLKEKALEGYQYKEAAFSDASLWNDNLLLY